MGRARWLWAPVLAVVVAGLLPIAVLVAASAVAGYHLGHVQTGSMEPTYPVGSLLVVEPVDPSAVRPGMAVSFVIEGSGAMVTHRVTDVVDGPTGPRFRTRGDANDNPDAALVPSQAVRGKVRWSVPLLGAWLRWVMWPRGFVLLVGLPAAWLLAAEVVARRRQRRARDRWAGFEDRYAVL
jgi:signal peptidase